MFVFTANYEIVQKKTELDFTFSLSNLEKSGDFKDLAGEREIMKKIGILPPKSGE